MKLSRHETTTSLVLFTVHMDNDSMVRISLVPRSKEEEEKGLVSAIAHALNRVEFHHLHTLLIHSSILRTILHVSLSIDLS